ncbi:STAS-like domain-containing protein [Photobacterium alginatilyticum]|uniref:STAS-like domain-containing protein n=1 Tax=Photobacterium alginatilyticum TaxID=1775171 RepID=UPI0040681CB0
MIIYIKDFTKFPGARYRKLGPYSGEEFRDEILLPAINEHGENVEINLDGVFGYGSSFLEEIFGGIVRKECPPEIVRAIAKKIVSDSDPDLIDEINEYIEDAISAK